MPSFQGRFDHAVILVADLAKASATFSGLGFAVDRGGEHTGQGTHNAIIRFGLDYLELLAVRDEAEALRAGGTRSVVVDRIHRGNTGLGAFALATTRIDEDATRLRKNGLEAEGPFPMQRLRPDGKLLSWKLLQPGGSPWGRPWPFFIQWDQDDGTRLGWERPGAHPNGTRRVAGVSLAVGDLDGATDLYVRQLGLARGADAVMPQLGSRCRVFQTNGCEIGVHESTGPGWLRERMASAGEGIFEVTLEVGDLEATLHMLDRANVRTERSGSVVIIPSTSGMGSRFSLKRAAL